MIKCIKPEQEAEHLRRWGIRRWRDMPPAVRHILQPYLDQAYFPKACNAVNAQKDWFVQLETHKYIAGKSGSSTVITKEFWITYKPSKKEAKLKQLRTPLVKRISVDKVISFYSKTDKPFTTLGLYVPSEFEKESPFYQIAIEDL